MGFRRDEGGQVILLAGILLTLGLILFLTQLALVANLGQQAARETRNPVIEDYGFIRSALAGALPEELRNETGTVECPASLGDYGGRVAGFLLMLTTLEQNRGLSFHGQVLNVTRNEAPTPDLLQVTVALSLTDGDALLQDTPTYVFECH